MSCFRIPPPASRRLMVTSDMVSVFDAAYSKWQDQWFMLVPGHGEEKIDPPLFWYCRDCETQSLSAEAKKEIAKPTPMPVINRRGQMMLNLGRVA